MAVSTANEGAGKNPGAAKPRLRTPMAGLEAPGGNRRNALAILALSSVRAKFLKAVSKGPVWTGSEGLKHLQVSSGIRLRRVGVVPRGCGPGPWHSCGLGC